MTRATTIELIAALAFGAAMTALDYYMPGPMLGVLGAVALFLGMLVSMSMQQNPLMLATMVLFWAAIGWVLLRMVRAIVTAVRSEGSGP